MKLVTILSILSISLTAFADINREDIKSVNFNQRVHFSFADEKDDYRAALTGQSHTLKSNSTMTLSHCDTEDATKDNSPFGSIDGKYHECSTNYLVPRNPLLGVGVYFLEVSGLLAVQFVNRAAGFTYLVQNIDGQMITLGKLVGFNP